MQIAAYYRDESAKNPAMVYCLGDDVARAIVGFLDDDRRTSYLRVLSQGIGEANEEFLRHDLPKLEEKHSVRFDRQQVIKLIEYWTLASETGPLDNERGIKVQPDLTPYVKNALTTFREIHSDVFACKVLGFKVGDYLDWVSGFVDSLPSLISQNSDLHRMLVVCETAFGRTKRQRFLRWVEGDSCCPFDDDVRSAALSEARSICSSRHYGYLVEYGRAVARSLDEQNDLIDQDSRQSALLGSIRDFAGDGTGVPRQMWQFWLRAMG